MIEGKEENMLTYNDDDQDHQRERGEKTKGERKDGFNLVKPFVEKKSFKKHSEQCVFELRVL